MINMFQEISAEARQHQDAMISELEQRLQGKLEQLSEEVQQEVTQRRTLLAKESKDREETCMAILKSLEDQLGSVEESLRRHEKELQRSLEATAATFAEKNTKEMMTTRQDVLELREELQDPKHFILIKVRGSAHKSVAQGSGSNWTRATRGSCRAPQCFSSCSW